MGPARWRKWLKVLALHARDPIWAPVLIPAAPLPFQLPACGPGKAVEDSPKLWDPAPVWETQKSLLASDRHSIGRCAHLGMNHRTEDLPLCLSSLYIRLPNK